MFLCKPWIHRNTVAIYLSTSLVTFVRVGVTASQSRGGGGLLARQNPDRDTRCGKYCKKGHISSCQFFILASTFCRGKLRRRNICRAKTWMQRQISLSETNFIVAVTRQSCPGNVPDPDKAAAKDTEPGVSHCPRPRDNRLNLLHPWP